MIVVAGESLVDLILHPDGRVVAAAGGGPFNTARTIARLGGACAYLGRLSTDRFGRMLEGALTADGVDLSLARRTDLPTTLAVAELDQDGSATYQFYVEGTAAPEVTPAEVAGGLPAQAAALHLGTLGLVLEPMASTLESLLATVADRVIVMLDPNARPSITRDPGAYRARVSRLLRRADVVKVSVEDLAVLAPTLPTVRAAREMLDAGPAAVLLTDGSRDVWVITAEGTLTVAVPAVDVVDAVGCGDAFGGGFLAWWAGHGLTRADLADPPALRRAAAAAVEVAALTCQRAGAQPPRRDELPNRDSWPAAVSSEPRASGVTF